MTAFTMDWHPLYDEFVDTLHFSVVYTKKWVKSDPQEMCFFILYLSVKNDPFLKALFSKVQHLISQPKWNSKLFHNMNTESTSSHATDIHTEAATSFHFGKSLEEATWDPSQHIWCFENNQLQYGLYHHSKSSELGTCKRRPHRKTVSKKGIMRKRRQTRDEWRQKKER